MLVKEYPVDLVFVQNSLKGSLVVGVEGRAHFLVVALAVFVPDIKSAIHERLAKAIPEEAGATIAPVVAFPTPEAELGKVGDAGVWVLGTHVGEKTKVLLGNNLTHGGRDEVTGKSRRHKKDKGKSDCEESEIVGEAGV